MWKNVFLGDYTFNSFEFHVLQTTLKGAEYSVTTEKVTE